MQLWWGPPTPLSNQIRNLPFGLHLGALTALFSFDMVPVEFLDYFIFCIVFFFNKNLTIGSVKSKLKNKSSPVCTVNESEPAWLTLPGNAEQRFPIAAPAELTRRVSFWNARKNNGTGIGTYVAKHDHRLVPSNHLLSPVWTVDARLALFLFIEFNFKKKKYFKNCAPTWGSFSAVLSSVFFFKGKNGSDFWTFCSAT